MALGTFIFMGRSGSGKGTQATLLEEYLLREDPQTKALYIQTGQHFREFAKKGTHTSALIRDVLTEGGLLPEFLPVWAWTEFLVHHFTGEEHLIFDGVTRRANEAPVLDGALKFYKRENPDVIVIKVSQKWATERLLERGRRDDTQAEIQKRLNWYESDVAPVVEFFKSNPYYRFHEICGEQTREKVHQEIVNKLRS